MNWQTDKAFTDGSACRPDCGRNIWEQKLGNVGEKGVNRCSMGVLYWKNSSPLPPLTSNLFFSSIKNGQSFLKDAAQVPF
jgi:hypothetical protein